MKVIKPSRLPVPPPWRRLVSVVLVGWLWMGGARAQNPAAPGRAPAPPSRTAAGPRTALDAYVAAPDTNYAFHLVRTVPGKDRTIHLLELTSQAWLTTNEVDRPVWKHGLNVVRPDHVTSSQALLFISGGANDGKPAKTPDDNLVRIALATGSVVAELKMVPNQPLVFAGETERRTEDSIIAYTWDKFLRTGDPKWPARLPMTKAAVRAMDTITTFCASPEGGSLKVDSFVVAGGSKRGWTTWTTAAVDQRVTAIVPFVIDVLNVEASMSHHYAAYGFWAPAVDNYTSFHIMDWLGTPENLALMRIEDPYTYRQRLTLPKFIINAAGDQFFLPDSSQFYFDQLPGVKYLRYVPNTDHSLKGSDAFETLLACYHAVLTQAPLPRFSWSLERDHGWRVTTKDKPLAVKLWQATNPDARDFRIETLGPKYESAELKDQGEGVYIGTVETPPKGWRACLVELTFPSTGPTPFKFTTPVRVVPDTLPYRFEPKGRPPAR